MSTLPHFGEPDIAALDQALEGLLRHSEAILALVIDASGFLVTHVGEDEGIDTTTLGALTAGAFAATQAVAGELGEAPFESIYHQGTERSVLFQQIDADSLLVVVFGVGAAIGTVKYYAQICAVRSAELIAEVRTRNPTGTVNLAEMNLKDSEQFFRNPSSSKSDPD